MNNSIFYRLNNEILIEYLSYKDNNINDYKEVKFKVVHNTYDDNIQIFNLKSALGITNNIQDFTVIHTIGNTYINVDTDKSPEYLDIDDKLIYYETDELIFKYDIIRVHFLTGYDFKQYKTNIINVRYLLNNNQYAILANINVNEYNQLDLIELNPMPIFLTDGYFNKYFDLIIPSVHYMNIEYYTSANTMNTVAGKITPKFDDSGNPIGNIGFIQNMPLNISLYQGETEHDLEINDVSYNTYLVDNVYDLSIFNDNKFDGISVYINESDKGNFIEFAMLHNNEFPSNFISDLDAMSPNSEWVIMHELKIYEHIGSIEKKTGEFVFIQRDEFDGYLTFRPVLKYSENDTAFSIDYIVRLNNITNGEQIIRHGSLTLYNPNMYGYDTRSIKTNFNLTPYKIYNKMVLRKGIDKSTSYVEQKGESRVIYIDKPVKVIVNKNIPTIINFYKIGAMSSNAMVVDNSDDIIYGQGNLTLNITPFDNFYKFILYEKNNNGKYVNMNLNILKNIKIVFKYNDTEYVIENKRSVLMSNNELKESIINDDNKTSNMFTDMSYHIDKVLMPRFNDDDLNDTTKNDNIIINDSANGIIFFKLYKDISNTLYKNKKGEFFITVVRDDDIEMSLYWGNWVAINQPNTQPNTQQNTTITTQQNTVSTDTNNTSYGGEVIGGGNENDNYKKDDTPIVNEDQISIINKIKPVEDV